jgi:hypothetical protein
MSGGSEVLNALVRCDTKIVINALSDLSLNSVDDDTRFSADDRSRSDKEIRYVIILANSFKRNNCQRSVLVQNAQRHNQ